MSKHFLLQSYLKMLRGGRLCILIFHRVLEQPDPLRPGEPTASEFEARMRWVKSNFDVLPLRDAVRCLREDRLPANALSITFDDGYADNCCIAAPILARLGLRATFFVAAGYLDGGCMFNDAIIEALRDYDGELLDLSELGFGSHRMTSESDRRVAVAAIISALKYLPPAERDDRAATVVDRVGGRVAPQLMMTSEEVLKLHRLGMEVGGHTLRHPILQVVGEAAARNEIVAGTKRLEEIVGEPIRLFAYPNGRPGTDYGRQHVNLAKALGFDAAVSTAWGSARPGADLYQLPRFTPWDRSDWSFGLRMLRMMAKRKFEVV